MALPTGSTVAASPATGDRSTQVATMAKFADEFAASLTGNGYQKFPSGLIIQWGYSTASTGGSAVTFPIAFPTGCLQVVIGQSGSAGVTYQSGALTTTGFTFYNTAGTGSHRWLAIGY